MTSIKSTIPAPPIPTAPAAEIVSLSTFLEQAEVCREQAREAARLKRFRSALGLFATASALCRHVATNGTATERERASDCLSSLALEMTTYNGLARISHRSAR